MLTSLFPLWKTTSSLSVFSKQRESDVPGVNTSGRFPAWDSEIHSLEEMRGREERTREMKNRNLRHLLFSDWLPDKEGEDTFQKLRTCPDGTQRMGWVGKWSQKWEGMTGPPKIIYQFSLKASPFNAALINFSASLCPLSHSPTLPAWVYWKEFCKDWLFH